jgi:glucuronoarabinoxylan endo-1,4-beta-xylanase
MYKLHERTKVSITSVHTLTLASAASMFIFISLFFTGVTGCRHTGDKQTGSPAIVDLAVQHQVIAGFGACPAWSCPTMEDWMADAFFSADSGLGMSLIRLHIVPDGISLEMQAARQAVARGALVWAAPWSPPAGWKDNHDVNNGGHLLPEHRQDWADRLASFVENAAAEGVPLIGISPQNEPGYLPEPPLSWETCEYTPESLMEFVRDYLGPALVKRGLATKVIAPETDGWNTYDSFATALANDSLAMTYVGPIATHSYSGAPHVPEIVRRSGHPVWQTEYTDLNVNEDTGLESALKVATCIHDDLVYGNVSAWHHWQFVASEPYVYSGMMIGREMTHRGWVIGNWSRFVRPGFIRVEATASPQDGVLLSAFSDPATTRMVVVIVNTRDMDLSQDVSITNGALPAAFTAWVTSGTLSLEQSGSLAVTKKGLVTVPLPARSVTTLVSVLPETTPLVSP